MIDNAPAAGQNRDSSFPPGTMLRVVLGGNEQMF
jgi:hypothetical protein